MLRRAAYAAVSPASRVADAIAPRRPAAALDPAASTAAGKINNRAGQPARQPAAQHTLTSPESPIEMITMIFLGYRRPGSRARNGSTRDL